MSQPFELRSRPGRRIFGAVLTFAVAAMLGFLAAKAVELDAERWVMFLTGLLALGALAFGLHELRRARDRRVKVVLDSEGFRDRRAGNVMVPWADVREVEYISVRNLKVIAFSGLKGNSHWVHMEIYEGSYGGRPGADGMDAVDTLYANTRNNPIEDIESHLPLRVERYELREGEAGAGRFRGGLGSLREFRFLADGAGSVEGEGHRKDPARIRAFIAAVRSAEGEG